MRPAQVRSRSTEVLPGELRLDEVRPFELRRVELRPFELRRVEVRPHEVCPVGQPRGGQPRGRSAPRGVPREVRPVQFPVLVRFRSSAPLVTISQTNRHFAVKFGCIVNHRPGEVRPG